MFVYRFSPSDVRSLWGRFDNKSKTLVEVVLGECPDDDDTTHWGPLASVADLGKAVYLEGDPAAILAFGKYGGVCTPTAEQVREAVEPPPGIARGGSTP